MEGLNERMGELDASPPPLEPDGFRGDLPNKELMAQARQALAGNWGMAVLGYFLCFLLQTSVYVFVAFATLFVGAVSGLAGANGAAATDAVRISAQLAELLFTGCFAVGFAAFFLAIAQGETVRLERLFAGFRRFWTATGAYLLVLLFVILWSLLLVIPGIIAVFRYAMVYFILADDPACGALEAISRSKRMMEGRKWKLFCLYWRFFWWALLAVFFTFGIGYLWLVPYMQTSFAEFYEDAKGGVA